MTETTKEEPKYCENCRKKEVATVPYYIYEGTADRFERSQKALLLVTVTTIILSIIVVGGASSVVQMARKFAKNEATTD